MGRGREVTCFEGWIGVFSQEEERDFQSRVSPGPECEAEGGETETEWKRKARGSIAWRWMSTHATYCSMHGSSGSLPLTDHSLCVCMCVHMRVRTCAHTHSESTSTLRTEDTAISSYSHPPCSLTHILKKENRTES